MTGSHTPQQLTLSVSRAELPRFYALFQRGVGTRAAAGSSVHDFLTCELGLAPDYVRGRITTVFLDGQVVDVLEDAALRDGSLLALSRGRGSRICRPGARWSAGCA